LSATLLRMSDVTRILNDIEAGDAQAANQLLPLVYDEMRKLAAAQMAREQPGQTLDATALVHEAWMRLADDQQFENRRHFFAAAAEAMRRILVDRARHKQSRKRGGGRRRLDFEHFDVSAEQTPDEFLALDEALARFAQLDERKAHLVKLRFFAGLTNEQAAQTLGISPSTADNWWAYARSWLRVEIERR
jgi:RNA polymerase sigma factor (TIGR02999 family)